MGESVKIECPRSGKTPILEIRKCPKCGVDVEVFSTDRKVNCPSCGSPVSHKEDKG